MKIAIHHRPGSFSDRWIAYCQQKSIDYKIVNCYDSDIVEQLKDCDALMWHHHHADYKDALTAKRILFALEHAGVKVFPNFHTGWHFDDKVAQKYLLEAIDAPLVPSYVFYDIKEALDWATATTYPKVFKLKGGAGAANVKLVRSKKDAIKLINTAFGKGFSQFNRLGNLKERYRKYKSGKDTLLGVAKGVGRLIIPTEFAKLQSRERGYVYFQEFIPDNKFDIRIVVIGGERAAGEKRYVRKNDFRASGSGDFNYEDIDLKAVEIAFDVSKRLNLQSVAFDFVLDSNKQPLIVEMSYGFGVEGISNAPGYWDSTLNWHEGKFNPQEWMVEEILKG
ncbi:Carbamoyl-phosphate synthase L chain, ATP binding domain [Porphyromonadaceae bacterium KHP3R9]|nr:Carbamoyl-phosphate synthase L chain, ATP binding domain [Porphyromonadaceae bacterium KHP3R9]